MTIRAPTRHSVTEAIRNYDRYNSWRLDKLKLELIGSQKVALDLIPFLLNEDLDRVGLDRVYTTIFGVSGFEMNARVKNLATQHFPIFNLEESNRRKRPIQFISIMGSAGSLAFTPESDLDIWVGINIPDFEGPDIRSFQRKLESIEKWFWEFANLETHFFISDIDKLRNEDYGTVGGESCGSALGKILKEEYYRTSLLLVGKRPYFPVVPPNLNEEEYYQEIEILKNKKGFPVDEFIDLGHLEMSGVDEFVGALLWQIVKGLNNPFKSVLKISLLKTYFYGSSLCVEEVLRSVNYGHFPDPYFVVARKVRDFEESRNEKGTARLIEMCFLLKCLSGTDLDSKRGEDIVEIASNWGYTLIDCKRFSDLRYWEQEEREQLKQQLLRFFLDSYKEIRESSYSQKSSITPQDMTVLAKILKAKLENRAGKVPWLFYLLGAKLFDRMNIKYHRAKEKWVCYIHLEDGADEVTELLTYHSVFPILIATLVFNHRIHKKLHIEFERSDIFTYGDANDLLQQMEFLLDENDHPASYEDFWRETTHVKKIFWIPNWEYPGQKYMAQSLIAIAVNSIGEWEYMIYPSGFSMRKVIQDWFLDRVGSKYLSALKMKTYTVQGGVRRPKRLADEFQTKIVGIQRTLLNAQTQKAP